MTSNGSAAPLGSMLIVLVTPAICFASGMILVNARDHSSFSRLERCALATACIPVTLGTLLAAWTVKEGFSLSGEWSFESAQLPPRSESLLPDSVPGLQENFERLK